MSDTFDGILDGAAIADEMMKDVPHCLRVRLAMDTLASAITADERKEIETILSSYLDEAFVLEQEFDWEALV